MLKIEIMMGGRWVGMFELRSEWAGGKKSTSVNKRGEIKCLKQGMTVWWLRPNLCRQRVKGQEKE